MEKTAAQSEIPVKELTKSFDPREVRHLILGVFEHVA